MKGTIVAGLGLALAGSAACNLTDAGTPLAEMADKQLGFNNDPRDIFVNLLAKDCPLLIPGTVDATVNGHAMVVQPGHHGHGFGEGPCYQPTFAFTPLPGDLGTTLTFVIRDSSQTLRAVIADYHPELPVFEAEPTAPWALKRGETVSISFTPPAEPPDQARAWFTESGTPTGPPPCHFNDDAAPRLADGQITLEVPTTLCYSPASLNACLRYTAAPHVESCENATCAIDVSAVEGCTAYSVTIGP